jgi:hypothetical protein
MAGADDPPHGVTPVAGAAPRLLLVVAGAELAAAVLEVGVVAVVAAVVLGALSDVGADTAADVGGALGVVRAALVVAGADVEAGAPLLGVKPLRATNKVTVLPGSACLFCGSMPATSSGFSDVFRATSMARVASWVTTVRPASFSSLLTSDTG